MSRPRKRRSTGNVTLADVAQKAGVGTMTVSRALRTPDLVSEHLREKIQQVVDELGYIPNKAAGTLASANSHAIALVIPSLFEKACAIFLPKFQHTLNKAGYQLLIGYSDYSITQEEKLVSTFLESRPAGVVLFAQEHTQRTHQLLKSTNTVVLEIAEQCSKANYLNMCLEGSSMGEHAYPSLTCAEFDYEAMGTKAAEKLIHAIKGDDVLASPPLKYKLKRRASTAW
jgi:LacI family gluconate utilization system Gnt-I transcriptional repressor